ncbi:MAG: YqjF family protein [Bacteroidia bacterium]
MSFLTAGWKKLAMANYAVDPDMLKPFVPYNTELDVWNGTHYASLIGFMFVDVKVLGIPVPFHVNFEEVNLRFYVRHKDQGVWKRGVVFIHEIVPKPAVTLLANTLYHEHYITRRMSHRWEVGEKEQLIRYNWKNKGRANHLEVQASAIAQPILPGSEEEFITEHYWGYTGVNPQKTFEYEVIHPRWEHYPVTSYDIDVDFKAQYGDAFAALDQTEPKSVLLAEGSAISIENKRRL